MILVVSLKKLCSWGRLNILLILNVCKIDRWINCLVDWLIDWQVIVTVLDDNDHPPVFSLSKYTFYVSEGVSIGSSVGIVSATDGDEGQNAMISFLKNDNNGSKCPCFKWVLTKDFERNASSTCVRGTDGRNAVRIRNRNWVALSLF